jgi:hypothetical protein
MFEGVCKQSKCPEESSSQLQNSAAEIVQETMKYFGTSLASSDF